MLQTHFQLYSGMTRDLMSRCASLFEYAEICHIRRNVISVIHTVMHSFTCIHVVQNMQKHYFSIFTNRSNILCANKIAVNKLKNIQMH